MPLNSKCTVLIFDHEYVAECVNISWSAVRVGGCIIGVGPDDDLSRSDGVGTGSTPGRQRVTATLEDFFNETLPPPDPLRDDLIDMIRKKADSNPRHLQRELGPSEVGHPCARKLAFGMMQVPRSNPEWDCLPSAYGVAMHTWLEEAAIMANERLGYNRWITERKVEVRPDLWGTADLYDTETATVIDWKNLGYTSFDAHDRDHRARMGGSTAAI